MELNKEVKIKSRSQFFLEILKKMLKKTMLVKL